MKEITIRKYDPETGPYEGSVPESIYKARDYRPVQMETASHGTVTIDWPWGGESGENFLDEIIRDAEAIVDAEL